MFGNKKDASDNQTTTSLGSSATNTMVVGTHIEGTINAQHDIRVDGKIDGTLQCAGRLIIGPEGKVEGDVSCQNAVIEGSFRGNLSVKEVLDVRETASVIGEIKTGKLLVQNGATFNGNCDMGQSQKIKSIPKKMGEANAS